MKDLNIITGEFVAQALMDRINTFCPDWEIAEEWAERMADNGIDADYTAWYYVDNAYINGSTYDAEELVDNIIKYEDEDAVNWTEEQIDDWAMDNGWEKYETDKGIFYHNY